MNGRHLDKAFLYKLNDDPGQANSQFGYCGLLDANNTPKESWYYVRTLQNVLTGSAFASDNTTLGVFTPNPGQPNISSTDLHCYLYENGLDKTLVVWSGTASGKKSIGKLKITFPGGSNYNFQFATIISVLVPDENGKREFRGNLSDNTIVNLQVSETPVFVKLQKDESDPPVQPVTGLTASASCCNGVRLSWDIPSNQTYQYYRVYYTPASSSGALPPFDISTWTLYAEQLPGTRREIVITGLEANTTYAFAVLPFAGGAGNEVLPDLANVVPYIYTTVDCSAANCLLSNSAFGVGTDPTVAGAVQNMLSSTGACNQLNDNPNCAFGWQGTATPGIDPSDIVTITFTKPQRINAIYLFTTGQGRLEFEFMGCDNCWAPLTRMEVYQTNNGQWTVLDASEIPPVPIKKIRVTRTGLIGATGVPGDGTGFAVCKMLFCAEESACPPPGGLEGAEQVKNLNALYVERDAALINWQTALAEASRPEWGIARLYEVSYSRTLGEDGQLIEPRVEIVEVSLNDALAWLRIFGLEPASTYHIQVKPLIRVGEPECETVLPGEARALITITTPDANGANGRSVESLKNEVLNAVRVYPNPATDWLRVESPKMGLRELEIWDAAGRMIIRKRTLNQPSAMSVNVVELPAGVYFLKIMGATGEVSIKPFVKIEE